MTTYRKIYFYVLEKPAEFEMWFRRLNEDKLYGEGLLKWHSTYGGYAFVPVLVELPVKKIIDEMKKWCGNRVEIL